MGMFRLLNNNPFSMVSENVYITRSDDSEGLILHIENIYGVKFTGPMGNAFFFESDEKHISTIREIFFGFNVYELRITHFQECVLIDEGEFEMEKNIFTIADFVNVQPRMPYAEVMELLGMTLIDNYPIVGNTTLITFNLDDGSEMRLLFFLRSHLISMKIVDPSGRSFVLQQEDATVSN